MTEPQLRTLVLLWRIMMMVSRVVERGRVVGLGKREGKDRVG